MNNFYFIPDYGDTIKIQNTYIYNMRNACIASGYPMATDTSKCFEASDNSIKKRASRLGKSKSGSGHDCFLKGITVSFDVTFPQYIWQQAKRYHWFDFTSSTSTMHRILKFDILKSCNNAVPYSVMQVLIHLVNFYNKYDELREGDRACIAEKWHLEEMIDVSTKEKLFRAIVSSIPSGLMLKASITTNYMQLKTMYKQRKSHKMIEWREFCQFLLNMPNFELFCLEDKK